MSAEAPALIQDGAELLSYAEAGERLGIGPESVKRRAQRERWPRQIGNDGRTRVAVPTEALEAAERAAAEPGDTTSPAGWPELVAELVRVARDGRQARTLAQSRMAELLELRTAAEARLAELSTVRAELERLRAAGMVPVRFAPQQLPPPGYAVERSRVDGAHRWRRLGDGSTGPLVANRWSAWRQAWAEHRRALE